MFGVRHPLRSPAYILHYSSITPAFSGLNMYLIYHNKSSIQVTRNLKSLGNFRGLGAFLLYFVPINRELKSSHICGHTSVKVAKVQDLGVGFGACVNRRRASSRKYRQLVPVEPKSRNHELAFSETQPTLEIMI